MPRLQTLEGLEARGRGREDLDVESLGVVLREASLHFRDDLRVVRTLFIEPENRRRGAEPGAVYGELHPVLDRGIFRLAGTPDVSGLHFVLQEHLWKL